MEKFNNIGLARELTSCYDFQGFTAQEVWSRIAQKINIIIEHFNYLDKKIENEKDNNKAKFDYLLGQGLTEQVAKAILEKIKDGSLGELINETLLKGINDKIDTFQETFTEQLEHKAPKEEIEKINSSVRLKSELMTMNDLSQDVINAISGGTTVNISSIPKDNSIGINHIKDKSKVNLYNKNTVTKLSYVDNSGVINSHASLCLSDFIPVAEGQQITITRAQTTVGGVYNVNKEWIAKIPNPSTVTIPYTFTVPIGGCYIRINEYLSAIDNYMVVNGATIPSSFISYGAKIDWLKVDSVSIEDKSVTNSKVPTDELDITCIKGVIFTNFFDKLKATKNKYIDNIGSILDSSNLSLSAYIPVKANTQYTVTVGYQSQGCYFDENKNFISKIASANSSEPFTFTTPANCRYVRLNMYTAILDTFMLVVGNTYPSEYTSYGAILPMVKQDNVYSPLQNKNVYIFGDSRTWYNGQIYGDGTKTEFKGQTCVGYQQEIINRTKANITSFGYNGKNSVYICERIKEKNFTLVDMVILDGGVNDYIVGATLGELKPIGSIYDTNTVYGAWQSAIEHIMASNPKCKIIVNTPFVCWNASGKLPSNIALVKKEIAELYSLDCLDLYNLSNINEFNRDNFYVDDYSLPNQWRLHLNNLGNKLIGGIIGNYILTKY